MYAIDNASVIVAHDLKTDTHQLSHLEFNMEENNKDTIQSLNKINK